MQWAIVIKISSILDVSPPVQVALIPRPQLFLFPPPTLLPAPPFSRRAAPPQKSVLPPEKQQNSHLYSTQDRRQGRFPEAVGLAGCLQTHPQQAEVTEYAIQESEALFKRDPS